MSYLNQAFREETILKITVFLTVSWGPLSTFFIMGIELRAKVDRPPKKMVTCEDVTMVDRSLRPDWKTLDGCFTRGIV